MMMIVVHINTITIIAHINTIVVKANTIKSLG